MWNSSIVLGRSSNHQFPSLGKTKIHWQDCFPVHQNHLRRQWHELMKARLSELGKCLHLFFLQKLPKRAFCARSKKNTKSHTWCVSFLRFGFLEKKISNTSSSRTQTKWNHMRPASSPQKSQTKTGLVAAFLWSSSREKRNLYIQVFTTSPGSGSSWNVFCFPNWRAFSWTTKNEAKTNDHYLKNHIYISANFRPTKIGTCLARIWKSNTDQQKKSNVAPVATFMGVFGEPWKSNKLRWQFRCWWFLGLKTVKRNRRGDQKPMQKHHVQIWNQKKGVENSVKILPPLSCEDFPWVDDSLLGGSSHLESAKNNHGYRFRPLKRVKLSFQVT